MKGKQSLEFSHRPRILGSAAVVGQREGDGPLGHRFDKVQPQEALRKPTWEQAEAHLQQEALELLLTKTGLEIRDLDLVLAGDLLNQCIASSFALRGTEVPTLGLYGACSTMAEALLLAGLAVDGGQVGRAAALTSSHFAASERQYRFPLTYGGQRTPTSQWTVTGAGTVLVGRDGTGPALTRATVGAVCDKGITDANNMGAAMAWAAYQTISAHLRDFGLGPEAYDLFVTGDLGSLGQDLVRELFAADGVELGDRYQDCGVLIFDRQRQQVGCGGSGCGCSAVVLAGHLLRGMEEGRWNRILFCGTGALLSPASVQQKLPIPGICHAVAIEN